jgi:hypothetical protein
LQIHSQNQSGRGTARILQMAYAFDGSRFPFISTDCLADPAPVPAPQTEP